MKGLGTVEIVETILFEFCGFKNTFLKYDLFLCALDMSNLIL